MPSTTPDLSTVTCGGASRLAAPDGASAPAKLDGDRPPRRGGASPGRPRSGFGQASSNDGGVGSAGPETGGASDGERTSGDSRSGATGSVVRVAERSRSLREDEENSRLRRGLTGGAASAGAGGVCTGPPSCDAVPSGPAAPALSPGG